jgi:glycerate-2-kinase
MSTKVWIKNFDELAFTPERRIVLDIAQSGLDAIDTSEVVKKYVLLDSNFLVIKEQKYDLSLYKRIIVLGFGKASGLAALALEEVLGNRITEGAIIGLEKVNTKYIHSYTGTHPLPSMHNVNVAKKMAEMIAGVTEEDLVICLVSGGGSALLCWDEKEFEQGVELYQNYLKTGDDIRGLNTVRKHISKVKGGGLIKMLYPATIIGLIFSDVAGEDNSRFVDSGPTYYDDSTEADAQAIIDKYQLGKYELLETPKDKKYFEKVSNVVLVSNMTALQAMKTKSEELGLPATIVSAELLEPADVTLKKITDAANPGQVVLGGSEIKIVVTKPGGRGGRNTYLAAYALPHLLTNDVFAAVASDGLDNGDCAGAIIDENTMLKIREDGVNAEDYVERFDGYSLFELTGNELIFTGPTEANVSDYLILYRK